MKRRPGFGALVLFVSSVTSAPVCAAGDFDCVIEPQEIVEIRSTVEGLIERVTVDRGDSVAQGQVVVMLDSGVERASADLAKQRSELEGAIRSGKSRVDFSTKKHARQEELFEQKYVSAQARDEAATEQRLAESEYREALDNRKIADLEYRRQMELLKLKTIRSPINGVVVERLMHPGEVAEAGVGRKPILKLADIDTLHVEVVLPVAAYGRLKVGGKAEVMPETPIGGRYSATIKVIDKVVDAASGTFGVRLELPNPQRKLPAGVRCQAHFAGLADIAVPSAVGGSILLAPRARADSKR